MGTHPIFESDFDYLTEVSKMADKNDELAQLEAEFQEVLTGLTDDPNLDKFRLEYEKIHTALKKSNGSNVRLQQKCRELNAEIVANATKVTHHHAETKKT